MTVDELKAELERYPGWMGVILNVMDCAGEEECEGALDMVAEVNSGNIGLCAKEVLND